MEKRTRNHANRGYASYATQDQHHGQTEWQNIKQHEALEFGSAPPHSYYLLMTPSDSS